MAPKFLMLAVSTLGSLAIPEALLRCWVEPYQPVGSVVGPAYPAAHSNRLGFTLPAQSTIHHRKPGCFECEYRTNNAGFRDDRDLPNDKPSDECRIVFCGDSFALGWGVDAADTLSAVAERTLNATDDSISRERYKRHRCVNAGYRDGYTLDQYHAFLACEAPLWNFDAVVVVVYSGNDLDDLRDHRWLETDGAGMPLQVMTRRRYTGFDGRYIREQDYDAWMPFGIRNLRMGMLAARCLHRNSDAAFPRIAESDAVIRLERLVGAIESLCRQRNQPLLWVLIPPLDNTGSSSVCEQVCLRAFSAQNSRFLSASRSIKSAQIPKWEQYIANDGHLAAKANGIVGQAIAVAMAPILRDLQTATPNIAAEPKPSARRR